DEDAAFRAQLAALGPGTTLLVDTYDTETGIRRAVAAAGPNLGAIRLDSGDPLEEVPKARQLLDELGATATRIVVTGDLDEYAIEELGALPVDGYGVGTSLVSGSGAPTAELVYKLVAVADEPGARAPLRPVAKTSVGKATVGGRKIAWRRLDDEGYAAAELLTRPGAPPPGARPPDQPGRPL